jgi:hypothetical protein
VGPMPTIDGIRVGAGGTGTPIQTGPVEAHATVTIAFDIRR